MRQALLGGDMVMKTMTGARTAARHLCGNFIVFFFTYSLPGFLLNLKISEGEDRNSHPIKPKVLLPSPLNEHHKN